MKRRVTIGCLMALSLMVGSVQAVQVGNVHIGNKTNVASIGGSNTVNLDPGTDRVMTFPMITGGVKGNYGSSNLGSYDGFSSYSDGCGNLGTFTGAKLKLLAAFLTNDLPTSPPASSFTTLESISSTELSPEMGQVFYVGDGRVGYQDIGPYDSAPETDMQVFHVPDDATRVVFGMVDSPWGDNAGPGWDVQFEVGQNPIPEPATMLAGLAGLAGLGRYLRRRK